MGFPIGTDIAAQAHIETGDFAEALGASRCAIQFEIDETMTWRLAGATPV